MKKSLPLIIVIFAILTSCSKDDDQTNNTDQLLPLQQQWGFALNYTASWCGPCGSWGAPLIHDFADAGNVVAITAHASGDPMHKSVLYNALSSDRPTGGGIPAFYIGDIKSTSMSDLNNLLGQIPKAGIALQYAREGSTMTIQTRTEFFSTHSGIFHLSVLILEDGIDGSPASGEYEQNGTATPDTYEHDFVLRASAVPDMVYGEELAVDPSKGMQIDKNYSVALNSAWTGNVYPVAIIWEKNSLGEPVFEYVNAVK